MNFEFLVEVVLDLEDNDGVWEVVRDYGYEGRDDEWRYRWCYGWRRRWGREVGGGGIFVGGLKWLGLMLLILWRLCC